MDVNGLVGGLGWIAFVPFWGCELMRGTGFTGFKRGLGIYTGTDGVMVWLLLCWEHNTVHVWIRGGTEPCLLVYFSNNEKMVIYREQTSFLYTNLQTLCRKFSEMTRYSCQMSWKLLRFWQSLEGRLWWQQSVTDP